MTDDGWGDDSGGGGWEGVDDWEMVAQEPETKTAKEPASKRQRVAAAAWQHSTLPLQVTRLLMEVLTIKEIASISPVASFMKGISQHVRSAREFEFSEASLRNIVESDVVAHFASFRIREVVFRQLDRLLGSRLEILERLSQALRYVASVEVDTKTAPTKEAAMGMLEWIARMWPGSAASSSFLTRLVWNAPLPLSSFPTAFRRLQSLTASGADKLVAGLRNGELPDLKEINLSGIGFLVPGDFFVTHPKLVSITLDIRLSSESVLRRRNNPDDWTIAEDQQWFEWHVLSNLNRDIHTLKVYLSFSSGDNPYGEYSGIVNRASQDLRDVDSLLPFRHMQAFAYARKDSFTGFIPTDSLVKLMTHWSATLTDLDVIPSSIDFIGEIKAPCPLLTHFRMTENKDWSQHLTKQVVLPQDLAEFLNRHPNLRHPERWWSLFPITILSEYEIKAAMERVTKHHELFIKEADRVRDLFWEKLLIVTAGDETLTLTLATEKASPRPEFKHEVKSRLRRLVLSSRVPSESASSLAMVSRQFSGLRTLEIVRTALYSDDAFDLPAVVHEHPSLQELVIHECVAPDLFDVFPTVRRLVVANDGLPGRFMPEALSDCVKAATVGRKNVTVTLVGWGAVV